MSHRPHAAHQYVRLLRPGKISHQLIKAHDLNVSRAGEPCRACGTPILSGRHGQRSTFWCPHCQH
ncbi:hypothetical protein CRX72_29470 [Pantoea sp. BRM17]|nr:hypothetical protein CRX72_29470 [Pantoea sp. BRM17]